MELVSHSSLPVEQLPDGGSELIFSTADITPALNLHRVTGAVFLSDLSLLVADASRSELIHLSPDGRPLGRFGRKGDGPGEFRIISSVGVGPGDTIFVYDSGLRRLSLFSAAGELARSHQADLIGGYRPLLLLEGGRVLGVHEGFRFPLEYGERRREVALTVWNPLASTFDTLGTWGGVEIVARSGRTSEQLFVEPIGFAASFAADGFAADVVVGSTDSLSITRYTGADEAQVLSASPRRALASGSDRTAIRSTLAEWYHEAGAEALVRDTLPLYHGVAVDDERRLWVGLYSTPKDRNRDWIVFEPDGTPAARVRLPALPPVYPATQASVHSGVQHELLDVRGGRIAVFGRDDLDLEFIEVRSLRGTARDPGDQRPDVDAR